MKKFLLLIPLALVIAASMLYFASKSDLDKLKDDTNVQIEKVANLQVEGAPVGASVPVVVSLFETSLQSSISSSDTSMTLVSGTDRAGTSLSGFMCFTIDEGTSVAEFVCGTASSTSVTGLTRGVSPLTGTSTVASLKYSHRRGASVKITDYPQLAILSRIVNGNETIPNPISYDSTIATSTFTTYNVVNKQYVDGVALQGSPTATTTVAGVVQIGTTAQIEAGTGMSGAYTLVPAGSLFSSTFRSATTVPITNASGKLAQGWLNLTESFTFTGTVTHSATTTLATTTISGLATFSQNIIIPATPTLSTHAASKAYVDNASSTITSLVPYPAGGANATSTVNINSNTTMSVFSFLLPANITVNSLAVAANTVSVSGIYRLGIFSEDGQTRYISTSTPTIAATGIATTSVSSVLLPQGRYYFGILPVGAAVSTFDGWNTATNYLRSFGDKPVYAGTVSVTADTMPTTINPTTLTPAHAAVIFRLDN